MTRWRSGQSPRSAKPLAARHVGSNPTLVSRHILWGIGQTVKMSACHAARSEFNSRIPRHRKTVYRLWTSALQADDGEFDSHSSYKHIGGIARRSSKWLLTIRRGFDSLYPRSQTWVSNNTQRCTYE